MSLPCDALFPIELWCTLSQRGAPADASLHSDLHSLHRGQGYVSKELCTGRGSKVETGTVEIGVLLRWREIRSEQYGTHRKVDHTRATFESDYRWNGSECSVEYTVPQAQGLRNYMYMYVVHTVQHVTAIPYVVFSRVSAHGPLKFMGLKPENPFVCITYIHMNHRIINKCVCGGAYSGDYSTCQGMAPSHLNAIG